MPKIMLTGGKGFLGSALKRELFSKGYKDVISFPSTTCDLTDYRQAEGAFDTVRPEVVIHLAARVGGIGANRANPGMFAYQNLAMGLNVIELSRLYGVEKLVIAGTICAYPKFTPVPFKEEDLWNGYPEETNAPYGVAKKMLLVLAQGYRQQYGCNFIYLLPVNLYGAGDSFDLNNSHVIPAMVRKFHEALPDKPVALWGDGTPTREFLFVDDCAEAFIAAMEKYDGPEPVNIGTGREISMSDLALRVQKTVGHKGPIVWDPSKPNGQPRRCLDTSRAKALLGWESRTDFDEGLARTYEWYKGSLS